MPTETMVTVASVVGTNGTVVGNGSYLMAAALTSGKIGSTVIVTRIPGQEGVTGIPSKLYICHNLQHS